MGDGDLPPRAKQGEAAGGERRVLRPGESFAGLGARSVVRGWRVGNLEGWWNQEELTFRETPQASARLASTSGSVSHHIKGEIRTLQVRSEERQLTTTH